MKLILPVKHTQLILILSSCNYIITDSGGLQEEANFLGKHIFVLRKVTERNAISHNNITISSLDDILNIDIYKKGTRGFEYGDGNSSKLILSILMST
jgi:UDP-N-acetylglucosamine 2-epimerase